MSTSEFRKDMITFYDIPFDVPGRTLSPNTFITRYSLIFKGLPFHTVWIELADVQEHGKRLGVEPTAFGGSKFYTLPIIHDPSTNTTLAESTQIAEYLDKTYPHTPRLIPPGTISLHRAFRSAIQSLERPIYPFIIPKTYDCLRHEASRLVFKSSREAFFGMTLEELTPVGEEAKIRWEKVKEAYDTINSWYDSSSGTVFFTEDGPQLADIVLVGKIFWIRTVLGDDSPQWKDLETWHGGIWILRLEKFLTMYPSN